MRAVLEYEEAPVKTPVSIPECAPVLGPAKNPEKTPGKLRLLRPGLHPVLDEFFATDVLFSDL